MNEVCIKDVGPIEELRFNLQGEGGVCVFTGPNGGGKSTAIEAVAALADRTKGRELTSRDGAGRGAIEGFGVELTIGRRTSARGELEVRTIKRASDPSDLVDPGLKSEEAADEERQAVLCRLGKVPTQIGPFAKLVGGEEQLRAIARPESLEKADVPAMADALRRDFQLAARKAEDEAENEGGRAAGLLDADKDVDLRAPHDAGELERAEERASRAVLAAEERQRAQRKAADDAEAARAALAREVEQAAGRPTAESLAEEIAKITAERDERGVKIEELRAAIREAQDAIKVHQAKVDELNARSAGIRAQRDEVERRARTLAAWQETVARAATPPEDLVTDDQIASLKAAKHAASLARDTGVNVRRALSRRAEADQAMERAKAATLRAEQMRAAARGVDEVVSEAIRAVAPRGLGVRDGRLVVKTDRGTELFTELSAGERWRIALDVAIDSVGEGGLLTIKQEAWEGLDPSNRVAVARHAQQRQVWILTAEADAGDLRAVIFPTTEGEAQNA